MTREMANSFEQSVLNSINKHIKSFSGDFQEIRSKLIVNRNDDLSEKTVLKTSKKSNS